MSGLNIAFFGSSLVSAYWNGAATYYRGIISALHERGHRTHFYEPDAFGRQQHRDIPDPEWARVIVYPGNDEKAALRAVESARGADLVIKASGVGVYDELLEQAVLSLKSARTSVAFWDVDAPATLDRLDQNPNDPFRTLIPQYDWIFTYGGGQPVIKAYTRFGAARCIPIYNALDPKTHFRVPPHPRFESTLAFLGNRLPDRESRVDEFFFAVATSLPDKSFLLGGSGWKDKPVSSNVRFAGHVYTEEHNAFNSTPLAVLNINRQSMASYGFSPPTRIFEAAGAEACIISDRWPGIDLFLEPEKEILIAGNTAEVAQLVAKLTPQEARCIGSAAFKRILGEHTYAHRAAQLEAVLQGSIPEVAQ